MFMAIVNFKYSENIFFLNIPNNGLYKDMLYKKLQVLNLIQCEFEQ